MVVAIAELWRYPVKSMQGEQLDRTPVTTVIPGDRILGVFDVETGHLLSGKRVPELLQGQARLDGDNVVLTLPGGEIRSDDPGVDAALSGWLDRTVTMRQPQPDEAATIAIEWDEGQAEAPTDPPIFEFATQPGWFYDSTSSLHLIGTATLAHIEHEVGGGAGDVRRYRPNIVAEIDDAFAEDAWVDATLALGEATAWVKKRTDRCVLITRPVVGYPASRDALKFLAATHDRNAGINLEPRQSGTMTVGDPVAVAG